LEDPGDVPLVHRPSATAGEDEAGVLPERPGGHALLELVDAVGAEGVGGEGVERDPCPGCGGLTVYAVTYVDMAGVGRAG
jgi:hypothetical protein